MTTNQMVIAKLKEDDKQDNGKEIMHPCFRLPILSLLVPFFVGIIETNQSQKNLTSKNKNDLFQTVEEDGGDDTKEEEEEDLKRRALEISIGDMGYSPPHQVSVGGSPCDHHCQEGEMESCSTMAESSDESPEETTVQQHRCGNCNFSISLHWRFCPECGVYIEGVTIITQTIHTLDLSQLESNVDTPKREESFMEELLEGLE